MGKNTKSDQAKETKQTQDLANDFGSKCDLLF